MPKADHLSVELKDRIVTGLLNLVTGMKASKAVKVPVLIRKDIRAAQAGFFVPNAQPLDRIKVGTVIGQLYQLPELKPFLTRSNLTGQLFLINRPGLVRTGDKLYSIGRPARL